MYTINQAQEQHSHHKNRPNHKCEQQCLVVCVINIKFDEPQKQRIEKQIHKKTQ